MKVRHISSGETYDTTREDFYNQVESKGNVHKFQVLEGDLPIEVKTIRQRKIELAEPEIEIKQKVKKQK